MLKIKLWKKDDMYEKEYPGPVEIRARMCFIDNEGRFLVTDISGDLFEVNPDEFMIDIIAM